MKNIFSKWMLGAVVLMAAGLVFCGCESDDSDSDITPTSFKLERELVSYDGTDTYTWDTTLSQARFEIKIKDFRSGDAIVRVYDARGKLILSSTLVTPSYDLYLGDNEFSKVGVTANGTPGRWTISLGYDQFTGEQNISMF